MFTYSRVKVFLFFFRVLYFKSVCWPVLCVAIGTKKVNRISLSGYLKALRGRQIYLSEKKREREGERASFPMLLLHFFLHLSSCLGPSLAINYFFKPRLPSSPSVSSLVYRQISSPHLHHTLYSEKGALIDTDSYLIALASLSIAAERARCVCACADCLRPPQSYYQSRFPATLCGIL